ncbi:ROK family protein [Lederbergia graminis]|uniref:ROK family protein n=1 Tax=Lederbergia graminis TaxID=735518 RepID=UPI0036D27B3D
MIRLNLKEFLLDDSIKNRTLKSVYQLIHEQGPISKVELLQMTKLKQTTLVRMLEELIEAKMIYESGFGKSSGGRPPVLYKIVPNRSNLIGIDISRTHITVMILDLTFTVIEKHSFPMSNTHTPNFVIQEIIRIIQDMMENHNLSIYEIIGIGIGSVGPIDRKEGRILTPESFPAQGWHNVSIVKQLKEAFPVKIVLENGANTAAIGEHWKTQNDNKHMLYTISGVGLRCGMLMNGKVVQNNTGDASSFGHMIIDMNGRNCSCGKQGCLLAYISYDAMIKRLTEIVQAGSHTVILDWVHGNMEKITFQHLVDAAKLEDPVLNELLKETAIYYGIGIANIINTLHPEHVILSGPLLFEHKTYFNEVVEQAKKYIYPYEEQKVTFSKGILKEDAVAVGAAIYAFQSFFD